MDYLRLLTSFRTPDGAGIRLLAVSQAFAEAITCDVAPVSTSQVYRLWMQLLGLSSCVSKKSNVINIDFAQMAWVVEDESTIPEMEISISLAGSLWSSFCRLVAGQVGVAVDRRGACDAWANHNRPQCLAVVSAIRTILYDFLSVQCHKLDSIDAVPPEEVFFANANSGRSFDQTYRRLAFSRVGLVRVK